MDEVQRLIRELQARDWSVAAIARAMEVDASTIRRWLDGARHPGNRAAVLALLESLTGRRPPRRPYERKS